MPRVALFSEKNCAQLGLLREILLELGERPLVCDMRLGGEGAPLYSLGRKHASWGGHDLTEVAAIYIRCSAPNTLPAPPPVLNAASYVEYSGQYLREQEFSAATASFFAALNSAGKLIINDLAAYADHDNKAQFYEKLRARQFTVPHTLTTNDPERAADFLSQHADVVVKPSAGVGSTRLLCAEDHNRMNQFPHCPVMMQERVRGNTLRVNIVGDTVVLALRILGSDESTDSRTAPRGFEVVELPVEEQTRIVRANRMLGLHFSAWDIVESRDDRYVYLDCNPGPYILWTGREFSRAVMEQLAQYLVAYAETGSLAQAAAQVRPFLA